MKSNILQPIGYQALITYFDLQVIPHYRASYISLTGSKKVYTKHGQEQHIYPKGYQLSNPTDPFLNLEFALKHEGMNFLIILFVFKQLSTDKILEYISARLQGKAQRKIWYLFEFLMHQQLPLEDLSTGNYIDLLDPTLYYTTRALKIKRQRINDNLLGFSHFCPFVRRTPELAAAEKKHLDKKAKELLADYEPFIIQRAASYLYTRETISSWHIEHEEPTRMRAVNFVNLLRRVEELPKTQQERTYQSTRSYCRTSICRIGLSSYPKLCRRNCSNRLFSHPLHFSSARRCTICYAGSSFVA